MRRDDRAPRTSPAGVDHERRLIGLISIGDLTKWVTRDLELHATELASYICGGAEVEIRTLI